MSEEPTLRFHSSKEMKSSKPKIMPNMMIPLIFRQKTNMSKEPRLHHETKQEWIDFHTQKANLINQTDTKQKCEKSQNDLSYFFMNKSSASFSKKKKISQSKLPTRK